MLHANICINNLLKLFIVTDNEYLAIGRTFNWGFYQITRFVLQKKKKEKIPVKVEVDEIRHVYGLMKDCNEITRITISLEIDVEN